jgi:hypothetical protein
VTEDRPIRPARAVVTPRAFAPESGDALPLEGTDFYLVDLRDARYDATQARLLRRSGAILE